MNTFCNISSLKNSDFLMTKRQFISKFGMGFASFGLYDLLKNESVAQTNPLEKHYVPKAKRVIHIFFAGGQSHIDTWDPKPKLKEMDGKKINGNSLALGSPFEFKNCGKSGIEVSEAFEKTGKFIDDACVIRSLYTDVPAHEVATIFMNTGNLRLVRPSLGSWAVYGLGSENQNLPSFISIRSGGMPLGGTQNFGSAFLPGMYQGTPVDTSLGSVEKMIQNIRGRYTQSEQRKQLDALLKLNEIHNLNLQKDPQLEARIQSFELAFKMQSEATDAFDINKETSDTRSRYGNSEQGKQMLIARRLVERGVRFVQVWTTGWDNHNAIKTSLKSAANRVDGPISTLIEDLKQRGLLEDTLIVMTGEFGRTATRDGEGGKDGYGRSHWNKAMSCVLFGGGIKGGTVYGATDELGMNPIENKVHVHDLHGTILYALGFDHRKLGYTYNGRFFRLTDVSESEPIKEIFV